nr:(d)CMP kinase [Desulfobacterales bacterium]
MKQLVITIDGPSGAGKSTAARLLAERLDYTYVDTGALYRAVALAARDKGCPPDDDAGLHEICLNLNLTFKRMGGELRIHANGNDISQRIRDPEVSMIASAVSARPVVRKHLLGVQRAMGKNGGVVFEGRDMGTVVFPEADLKFYLDANPQIRTIRRYRELVAKGLRVSLNQIAQDIRKRDENDSHRRLAPLRQPRDAIRIDSSHLTMEEVIRIMLEKAKARLSII